MKGRKEQPRGADVPLIGRNAVPHPAGSTFTCQRCRQSWQTRKDGKPLACAKCKSFYWDKPEQVVPRAARGAGTAPVGGA